MSTNITFNPPKQSIYTNYILIEGKKFIKNFSHLLVESKDEKELAAELKREMELLIGEGKKEWS